MNEYMKLAIQEARKGIKNGHGGPFGAVIVKNGEIIGKGHNRVLSKLDPTLHGEIDAIKNACKCVNSINLKGADIYTTGEPCPMCLGAILWANINKVFYGCTIEENEQIGFRDKVFYDSLKLSTQKIKNKLVQIEHDECKKLFQEYASIKDKTNY